MKYRVYLDELENKSRELINYSKKDITDKINELKLLGEEIIWHGPAHDNYIKEYNKRIEKLQALNNKICLFGEYLKFCSEHYGETQEKLTKNWNKYLDEIGGRNEL